jgi:hypothetical protein
MPHRLKQQELAVDPGSGGGITAPRPLEADNNDTTAVDYTPTILRSRTLRFNYP